MYFQGDDTQTGANNAVAAVGTFWNAVDTTIAAGVTWSTEVEVAILTPAGQLTGFFNTTPQSGAGTGASDMLPLANQGVIKWRTGVFVLGREIRGRTFVPGLKEENNFGGVPQSSFLTTVNAAAAALINDLNAQFSVWSRKNSTVAAVITGSTNSQWGVLRSRRD